MAEAYLVREATVDGPVVGTYTRDDPTASAGPQPGEIIEVDGKRWRITDAGGEGTLLVAAVEDFEGLDDVEMALRHADQTRDDEQDDADNADSPSGPEIEPGPRDRYT